MIRARLHVLSLIVIACLVYFPVVFFPFVHDDIVFIKENPSIRSFDHWPEVFSKKSPGQSGINTYYRPLLELVYRFEYALYGLNPAGWHLFNVLLHAANGVLVFILLSCIGFGGLLPWAGALVFLIHPVQTEAVACVAGISNLMMGFSVLLALILYLKDKLVLSILAVVVGVFCKEGAMMAFPLMLLIDWWRGRLRLERSVILIAMGLALIYGRGLLSGAELWRDIFASPGELKLRVLAIGYDLMMYLRLMVWPVDLHYYRSTDFLAVSYWWWGAVLLCAYWTCRQGKLVQVGALWFVLALLPTLNIIPLVNEYSQILTAEHFLYLPILGFIIVILSMAKLIIYPEKWLKGFFVVLVMLMTFMTLKQNMYWRDEISLFRRTIAFEPNFGRGHLLLAKAYYFNGQLTLAELHLMRAYIIMRTYESRAVREQAKAFYRTFIKEILFCWAHIKEKSNDLSLAQAKYIEAIVIDAKDPVLWNNLAVVALRMGRVNDAKAYLNRAAQLRPAF